MAGVSGRRDQLQPSLLDRLTNLSRLADDDAQNVPAGPDRRAISIRTYRALFLLDLGWLFNTENLAATTDLEDVPEVAQSVLNFGVPALAGHTISSADVKRIERQVRDAICAFEPRILKDTLKVRIVVDDDQMNRNAMGFEVEGQLWAEPTPLRLMLRSQVDLDTGEVKITDRGDG